MTTVQLKIPDKLISVFLGPARYRGAYGGRGSAKTRTFAKMAAVRGLQHAEAGEEGVIVCAREFMNSLADSSMSEVKAAIKSEPWLEANYDIGETYIRTKDRRVEFAFVGLRHNLDSIKSKARILLCWVDEAEPVTENAWQKLIPTVREDGSEIWVTWNPERETSPTHKRFRLVQADDMKIIELNWRDNRWFPDVLERERLADLKERPDTYDHIWEGGFLSVIEGAYFATHLRIAKEDGRIGRVPKDPNLTVHLFADIGGTGAKADSFVFWAVQFVGRSILVLDYYEKQGQPIATHLEWMRKKGFTPGRAQIWLPHDGATQDKVFAVSYESAFRDAGYHVEVIPNQGRGAAGARIEASRKVFSAVWFNEEETDAGRKALGWYHEKIDDKRNVGLGPDHDWASHGADAFGLMAIVHALIARTNANDDDDEDDAPRGRSQSTGY